MNEPKKKLGPVRVTARAAEVYAEYAGLSIDDAVADLERILPAAIEANDGSWRYRRKSDRLDISARVTESDGVLAVHSLSVRGHVSSRGAAKREARDAALGITRPPRRRIVK